jgi:hypothetical protein
MIWPWVAGVAAAGTVGCGAVAVREARRRALHRWLLPNLFATRRPRPVPGQPIDVLIAVCDHYEPKRGKAPPEKARARVQQWVNEYPRLFGKFRDSDSFPPRHSYFYPEEEYEPEYLDMLAGLCRAGYGEVEIHLHHDNDTADNLRQTMLNFKRVLADRHGLLARDKQTGEIVYGFIHGNWALNNARSDGRWCGINNELDILRETGCYADFTLPSAPSETQTRKINSIYWAVDDPARPKSHDTGIDLGTQPRPDNSLLMIQGPLALDWSRRKWGVIPGVENANLQKNQPPSEQRLDLWMKTGVCVPSRPNWCFIKLHTHGINEPNQDVLIGEPMVRFHELLRDRAERDPLFRFHYVTAREMANIALAAEQGVEVSINEARSFRYVPLG